MKKNIWIVIAVVAVILIAGGIWAYNQYLISPDDSLIFPSPTPTESSLIKVLSPNGGEKWEQGKTYKITWSGGVGKISIFLLDKSLEPQGASVSKSWTISNIDNKGFYDFVVPKNLIGTFRLYISDNNSYAYSNYFDIF